MPPDAASPAERRTPRHGPAQRPWHLLGCTLLGLPWAAAAQQPGAPLTGAPLSVAPLPVAPLPGAPLPMALACLILPSRVADVGSPVIGVVESLEVERGDKVRKGQVLARLRADVERASFEAVRSRAQSEAEVRGAEAGRELAKLRLDRARTLAGQNYVSAQAVEQAQAEYQVAFERVAQAHDARRTATRELGVSSAQTDQRLVRSPFDGVVVERYANLGERFEDKPLVKVAAIAHLRVEVVAPTALFGQLRLNQEVRVMPELPGAAARTARIAQIDQVLDPASNTFRVRLDLPNPDHALPAGLRCKVDLGLASGARPPVPAGAAASR